MTPQIPTDAVPPAPEVAIGPVPPGDLGPIKVGERIAEMDILRGFALLGICVINLQDFLGPSGLSGDLPIFPAWYDQTAEFLIDMFGQGKFNAMFSFLFGVGFAIQMGRASAKGAPFASMYLRRLLALFLFGVAHVIFLWDGDVLHIYAAIGLPLILCRNLRDRWLWLFVALTLIGPFVVGGALLAAHGGMPSQEKKEQQARKSYDHGIETLKVNGKGEYFVPPYVSLKEQKEREKAGVTTPSSPTVRVMAHSTYSRVMSLRIRDWLKNMSKGAALFWPILGTTLLIGFIAGRRGIFQDIPGHRRFILWTTIVSGVVGLGIAAVFATASLLASPGEKTSLVGLVAILGYIFGRPFLCAFYMGVLIMLAQTDRFRRLLAPLALVGRMPLTNYLMHSVVFSLLFYGYGVGLFYRVGPALSLPIAFTLYAIQVVYSNWWMKRFRFGPMEWLWRTMTYGKLPAMRLPSPTP